MELYRMLTMNIRHTIYTICQSIKTMAIGSLLCLAVQSCNKQSHPLTPEEDVAISMNATSVEGMETSRAIVTDNATLQSTAIGVYAYKELANGTQTMVFDNERVYYSSGWKYDNTKYWDKAATEYRFVAYSPRSTSNISYNTNNHTLTISNIPYWQVINGSEVDYLVANSHGSAESYLSTDSKSVPLAFSHILSQLVINITKDATLSDTEYKLKQVDYLNVPQGGDAKATYTLPQEGTATMSEITLLNADATLTQFTNANGQAVEATSNIPLSHLVVPFTLSNSKKVQVKVTYTVEGTPRAKTVDTGITQLEAGKRYELTLTFKGAEIVPSLEIKNWEDVENVEEDPKYNW